MDFFESTDWPRPFDEVTLVQHIKHYLPAQAPLKDFIHHNTLHAFQEQSFFEALSKASAAFGYTVFLPLASYRSLYAENQIDPTILYRVLWRHKANEALVWKGKLLNGTYDESITPRINQLRANWKHTYHIDLDLLVHPILFRVIGSYLDQGVSLSRFPIAKQGFWMSLQELEKNSISSLFNSHRVRQWLFDNTCSIEMLLTVLVKDKTLFESYLFDQQFAHPGWSGIVAIIEDQPLTLLDPRSITLRDWIMFELLLEIDALDTKFDENWAPLGDRLTQVPVPIFAPVLPSELMEVKTLWQEAYEWSYYDQVLAGISSQSQRPPKRAETFQAIFCIDDRECSIRRHLEQLDPLCLTYGTPGFFGVAFYYQPSQANSYTKQCPAPVKPTHLVREIRSNSQRKNTRDIHFEQQTHALFWGWILAQTVGFWSIFRLILSLFRPTSHPAMVSSSHHMHPDSQLTIENQDINDQVNGLQIGFTVEEMVTCVHDVLRSIGLVDDFAPLVYVVGHGASSVNNTHYAGYDCGACAGRPGSVNARVFSFMANHTEVRAILKTYGIDIPVQTTFIGALHDTTRDDISFYDVGNLAKNSREKHDRVAGLFENALDLNAKERSRRFISVDSTKSPATIHTAIRARSVSLFEPRPELNHATNALCIVGRREVSSGLFLDRRAFMNSYDYRLDPSGLLLASILGAVAPVCGGINLEYYFSRVDNQKLGAGSKLPHNVMGLIGVANGIDGDLRSGLPSQMIEVHDPIRLMVLVEHFPETVLQVIQQSSQTYNWFRNGWIHLVVIHPENRAFFLFKEESFESYVPIHSHLPVLGSITELGASGVGNLPVYLIQSV